ncbi:MAG: hypothetical protein K0S16_71 [Moraxellaceae bacterium]|jgi:inner membrane protein|nr:hypothetical protein [Moraxellaceae bacterium]
MFIAHLPAGYLLCRYLHPLHADAVPFRSYALAGMAGAVAPDLDLFWFFLVDSGRIHHHAYPTHFPVLWLALLATAMLARTADRNGRVGALMLVFALNGLLHMVLDSVVGDIRWLAPWSEKAWALFRVPARFQPWWLSFVLHWTFVVELLLSVWALGLFRRSSARGNGGRARSAHRESAGRVRARSSCRDGSAGCPDRR